MRNWRDGFMAVIVLLLGIPAWAEPAGKVIRVQGSAVAQAGTGSRPLAVGDPVEAGDTLRTAKDSRLLVLFADGMELTLSQGAQMRVSQFQWNGPDKDGKAELALADGSFLLATGGVGKLAGHPLTVKTPLASVGVRGTRFWGGPLDAPFSVLLIEGKVVVGNDAGSVELGTPGEGTSVESARGTPRPPSYWGEERIRRAFDTVSFR